MRKVVNQSDKLTKRHSANFATAYSLQEFKGETLRIIAAATGEVVDDGTGEMKNVSYLVGENGEVYSSISATVRTSMEDVIDLLNEEGALDIKITERQSKNGRNYIQLIVL